MVRKLFKVEWEAHGEASVFAESEEEAQQIVDEGLEMWQGDIEWEAVDIWGAQIYEPKEM